MGKGTQDLQHASSTIRLAAAATLLVSYTKVQHMWYKVLLLQFPWIQLEPSTRDKG
jgi:hypothetical protein